VTVYLPDKEHSELEVKVRRNATVDQIIKTALACHKEEGDLPPLKYQRYS